MRGADESRPGVVPYARTVNKQSVLRILLFCLCAGVTVAFSARDARRADAASAVTLPSGTYAARTTIPVTIDGHRTSCILDTGSSAVLVSPALAHEAGLPARAATFEVAPDGRSYMDRQTEIHRLGVAGYSLNNVPALISSNLTGNTALCGYDFLAHYPLLVDRDRQLVTLFPTASQLDRMHCITIDLSSRVALATVEINDTRMSHIVLDSGMAGGGVLWEGARTQLRHPLVANADYQTMPDAARAGMACGSTASIRYTPGSPASAMPICTEPQRPDGYNGMLETNLSSVHALAVDYPHHRMCFEVGGFLAEGPTGTEPTYWHDAWSRFKYLRPPN
jgi:gag-polyprotein putative aspartyl protease